MADRSQHIASVDALIEAGCDDEDDAGALAASVTRLDSVPSHAEDVPRVQIALAQIYHPVARHRPSMRAPFLRALLREPRSCGWSREAFLALSMEGRVGAGFDAGEILNAWVETLDDECVQALCQSSSDCRESIRAELVTGRS
jgi:hypothetical protein